jgi:hypothetical protein
MRPECTHSARRRNKVTLRTIDGATTVRAMTAVAQGVRTVQNHSAALQPDPQHQLQFVHYQSQPFREWPRLATDV